MSFIALIKLKVSEDAEIAPGSLGFYGSAQKEPEGETSG
jgi:hypothetical protein